MSSDSVTVRLLDKEYYEEKTGQAWFVCEVCGGKLHEPLECATKKRFDAFAKKNNDNVHWGQWKYETYYNKFE